jgi:hypothetical protein
LCINLTYLHSTQKAALKINGCDGKNAAERNEKFVGTLLELSNFITGQNGERQR